MRVTTSPVGPREVELTIEPDTAFLEQAMRRAAQRISRVRPVPGYRPGRAPYVLVERIHGRELILDEALEHEAQAILNEAVREAQIEPLRPGTLSLSSHDPVVLKARVPLVPEVNLGDYTTIRIPAAPPASVSEDEIDREVEALRRRHAQREAVDRAVQMGDEIVAQIVGRVDGKEVINSRDSILAVTDDLQPGGFAEAVQGMQTGEERQFTLTYASDYGDEQLAGKQVEFTVTVSRVRQVNLPPVDDALAKLEDDYASLDALRAAFGERLLRYKERAARASEADQAVDALIDISRFDYPDVMLASETDSLMNRRRALVQQAGYDFDAYLRMIGKNEKDMREELNAEAAKRIARRIVLGELARAEKITLTEEESDQAMRAWYLNVSAVYGRRAEEAASQLARNGALQAALADALTEKAAAHLADIATGRTKPQVVSTSEVPADAATPPTGLETESAPSPEPSA